MNTYSQSVLDLIDALITDAREGLVSLPVFVRKTELREIWHELAFCITSSQERTRRALAAASALTIGFEQLSVSSDAPATVRHLLAENFVSLRFMNRKSEHLAVSWRAMLTHAGVLARIDEQFQSPSEAREFLIGEFPGLGPKQASMLLRNIGYGADLAIIDSHVTRISMAILDPDHGADSYFSLESQLREFASDRNVSLQTLDVILWSCARMIRPNQLGEQLLV